MTLPVPSSFSGKAEAGVLGSDIINTDLSFTITSTSTWTETVGSYIGQPLGTSGPFVITLDYGYATEEKVLCTGIYGTTVYVYNSGGETGRGYDGTSAIGHSASAGGPIVHTYSADVPFQANLGVTNAAAAQSTANTAQSTANAAQSASYNVQVASTTGKIYGTIPSTATPLKVVGWTATITTANQSTVGAGVSIPYNFPNVLMSVVGTFSNESSTAGAGSRCTIDTNSATNSFRVWIYNAAGSKVANGGTYQFSFVAVGY